jgi:hypothetical protein
MWRLGALVAAPLAVGLGFAITTGVADAATASGTAITNTATASYSDGTNTYTSQSNTVTTTVQNAPSLTITPLSTTPGGTNVSQNQAVTSDAYTLTNTGNGPAEIQLPGTQGSNEGVTTTATASGTSYSINSTAVVTAAGAANGTTTAQTFATLAALNTYLNSGAPGGLPFYFANGTGPIITALYTATAASGTVTTQLQADSIQPAGSGTTLQTSSNVLGQYNDTISPDARIDMQKFATVGGTVAAPTVQYIIDVANGGAKVLQPVFKNGLPGGNAATYSGCTNSTACGIVITDKIPLYNAVAGQISGTPSVNGTGNVVIYSTDGTNWTTTLNAATDTYIGVFVPASNLTGASLATFQFNSNTTSTNNVPTAKASLILTFTVTGSTASGSANSNAVTNVVNSEYADNAGFIEGPGITTGSTANNSSSTAPTATTAPVNNTNGSLTGSATITSADSPPSTTLLNGPNGFPGATGIGASTATDYTALDYSNGGTILAGSNGGTGNSVSVPSGAAALTFTNSVQNTGNKFDTFTLTAATATAPAATALPTGWTVTYTYATTVGATANCPATTAGTALPAPGKICVESGATANYNVIYTPPASITTFTPFAPYGDAITATSANNTGVSNITNDEFFVGGFLSMLKSFQVTPGQGCAAGGTFVSQTTALPGDCVQYTITYTNNSPSGGTNSVGLTASSFTITEDGSGTATASNGITAYTNNWGTYTNGLYAAPVDSRGGTITNGTAGSKSFTDAVGTLAPAATGTLTFKAQVL